jgi:hypothetical protein
MQTTACSARAWATGMSCGVCLFCPAGQSFILSLKLRISEDDKDCSATDHGLTAVGKRTRLFFAVRSEIFILVCRFGSDAAFAEL